jgi:chorismate mutase/prephenate dehydratase
MADRRDDRLLEPRELESLRAEIDALDIDIVRLLNRRATLGLAAGHAKTRSGRPLTDAERERDVLVRISRANEGPLPQAELLALYRQLIETIKHLEEIQNSRSSTD